MNQDGLQEYLEELEYEKEKKADMEYKEEVWALGINEEAYEEKEAREMEREIQLIMEEKRRQEEWMLELQEMKGEMNKIRGGNYEETYNQYEQYTGQRELNTVEIVKDEQINRQEYRNQEQYEQQIVRRYEEEDFVEKYLNDVQAKEIQEREYQEYRGQMWRNIEKAQFQVKRVQPQVFVQDQVYVQEVRVQPQVFVQEQVYVQQQLVSPTFFVPSLQNNFSSAPFVFQSTKISNNFKPNYTPVMDFNTLQPQVQQFFQQQYLQQATINALHSPILLGQQTFPSPQPLKISLEQINLSQHQRQNQRYQHEQKLQRQQQLQMQNEYLQMQRQRQIQREQAEILMRQLKQQQQLSKFVNQPLKPQTNLWNQPVDYQNRFQQEQVEIITRQEQQFIEINVEQEEEMRQRIKKEEAIQRQKKIAYERAQLAKQQVQIFNIKQAKQNLYSAEKQFITYSQPAQEQKFTIQKAIALKDPSILLQSQIYYNEFFQWKQGLAELNNLQIKLPDKTFRISEIDKLKIMKQVAINNSRKIKLSYYTQFKFFAIDYKAKYNDFPLHYFWFAKIITEKLKLSKGWDFSKAHLPKKDYTNVNVKNRIIDGVLYKKSQYVGRWQLRYIAITQSGLFSFKDEKGGETFSIKKETTNELWTRFDIHDRMLVIKVHHNNRKTEFGIPIVDYCIDSENNWLYPFYQLVYSR